jgi:hypothetical protein
MFSYFTATIVLIFLGYAVISPLLLWITPLNAIDRGFYRFNLGLCCIIGALGFIDGTILGIILAIIMQPITLIAEII